MFNSKWQVKFVELIRYISCKQSKVDEDGIYDIHSSASWPHLAEVTNNLMILMHARWSHLAQEFLIRHYHKMHYLHNFLTWLRKCQIFLVFLLKWFVEENLFTFKKKSNFECQMASVGTWSQFSPECENGQYPPRSKIHDKGIRCCVWSLALLANRSWSKQSRLHINLAHKVAPIIDKACRKLSICVTAEIKVKIKDMQHIYNWLAQSMCKYVK